MPRYFRLVTCLAAALLIAGPARGAQESTNTLENELQRLSEILGALHYLRGICSNDGPKWRADMQALLDAEAQGSERRGRLIASFNRGYRGFQQSYRTCTDSAKLAIERYLQEGAKISREITARYSN
ncbi:MAG: TIGR02301 family protein [Pseudorhodoplanes sp.]